MPVPCVVTITGSGPEERDEALPIVSGYRPFRQIADALGRRGITVDRHKVELDEPLKALGTYKVAVKVYAGLTPEVTIVVEPKG